MDTSDQQSVWRNEAQGAAPTLVDDLEAAREHAAFVEMTSELHKVKDQSAHEFLEQCIRDGQELATRARHDERPRLAQMLHDGMQQLLVAAKMRLNLWMQLPVGEDARRAVLTARDLLTAAIRASRTLTLELNPPPSVDQGLGPALTWLSDWFGTCHGLKVTVEVATDIEPESQAIRTLMFQGVREILLNVVKHAGVPNAHLRLVSDGTDVQIVIEDRGTGFELTAIECKTNGLFDMKRRMELSGGAMEVISAPGAGTRVTLKAPVAQAEESAVMASGRNTSSKGAR